MTTAEIEYRGVTFPENTVVLVSAWHANRDGATNPEAFDITPRARRCACSPSAPASTTASAPTSRAQRSRRRLICLAEHFQEIQLDGEPQYGTPSGIYGLEALRPLKA